MSGTSPFSQAAMAAATKPIQAPPPEAHPAAETDIYRTFSPTEIAFWDFKKPQPAEVGVAGAGGGAPDPLARKWSAGGLFSKLGSLFGSSGPTK